MKKEKSEPKNFIVCSGGVVINIIVADQQFVNDFKKAHPAFELMDREKYPSAKIGDHWNKKSFYTPQGGE